MITCWVDGLINRETASACVAALQALLLAQGGACTSQNLAVQLPEFWL